MNLFDTVIVLKITLLHSVSVITNFVFPKRDKQTDKQTNKETSHFFVYSRRATHDDLFELYSWTVSNRECNITINKCGKVTRREWGQCYVCLRVYCITAYRLREEQSFKEQER